MFDFTFFFFVPRNNLLVLYNINHALNGHVRVVYQINAWYTQLIMVFVFTDNTEWVNETPKTLWKKIVDEVQDYFHYTLDW